MSTHATTPPIEPGPGSHGRHRARTGHRKCRYFAPITRLPRVDQWPPSHQAAWAKACFKAGPLDPAGRLAHLRPSSLDEVRKGWARIVTFLIVTGQPVQSETPAQSLTPERLPDFIASLAARVSPYTLRMNIRSLYSAINAMAPKQDWNWVRHHPALPREAAVQAGRKQIIPPDPVALLRDALEYCDAMDRLPGRGVDNSVGFRDGLLVATGVSFGIRHKNLWEMQINRHLILGDEVSRLVFDEVKNGACIDSLLPDVLRPYIERYSAHHRKILLGHNPDVPEFWISAQGRPLGYCSVFYVFQRMGQRLVGRPITVHSVRYAAATMILDDNPYATEVASAVLAHRGTSSVGRYYDKSAQARANRVWAEILRRSLRRRD